MGGLRKSAEITRGEHKSEQINPGRNNIGTGKWAKRPGGERANGRNCPD